MSKAYRIFYSFILIILILLGSVDFWCFNRSFYHHEYEKINNAETIGVSDEDLDTMTEVLLHYLRSSNSTLDLQVEVNGEMREVFNQREKAHMVDVKNLYQNAMKVAIGCLVLVVVSMIVDIKKNRHEWLGLFRSAYLKALAGAGILLSVLGVFILSDFDTFWLNFHYVFFPGNDLWLLDPRADILIMMVPGEFFNDLVVSIFVTIVVLIVLIVVLLNYFRKKLYAD